MEVLVALAIVAVCLASLLGMYLNQVKAAQHAQERRGAIMLADSKLAEAASADYPEQVPASGSDILRGIEYRWRFGVDDPAEEELNSTAGRLCEVTVNVSWGKGKSRRSLELSALASKRGKL